ncbi:MAG: hypothetical protein KDC38_11935 [Planctomycetes bacterium]|nr:hypothetical protein [Planctomycetota bacterium]
MSMVTSPTAEVPASNDGAKPAPTLPPEILEVVREVFQQLTVTEKNARLFPPENRVVRDSMRSLLGAFSDYFSKRWEPLRIRITESQLLCESEPVYESADKGSSLAFRMYKDGLKELRFLTELGEEELLSFLLTFKEILEVDDDEDDFVTLLWEKDLDQIQFFALDDFLSAGESVEVPSTVCIDRKISPPRGKRGTKEQQDQVQELIDRVGGNGDAGARPAFELDEADVASIQQRIESEIQKDPFDGFVEIVLETIRRDTDEHRLARVMGIVRNLLVSLVDRYDYARATEILERLSEAKLRPGLVSETMKTVAQEETLKKIEVYLREENELPADATIYRFLRHLPSDRLEWLIEWVAIPGHEIPLIEILAERGTERKDLFVECLSRENSRVVLCAIDVLARVDFEGSVPELVRAIEHPDPEVRRTVSARLAHTNSGAFAGKLLPLLNDPDRKTQLQAVGYFARNRHPQAFSLVQQLLASQGGKNEDPKWLLALMQALLNSSTREAIEYLEQKVFKTSILSSLLKRTDNGHLRLAATYAIGGRNDAESLAYLERLAKSRDPKVKAQAAFQLKNRK